MTRRARLVSLTAVVVLVVDRLTKGWALAALHLGDSIPIIPGVVHLTLVRNPGVAFGLLARGGGLVAILAAMVVAVFFLASLGREAAGPSARPSAAVAMGLILGGAAGNLWDRLRLGEVVDFLDLRVWPVFNVADSGITVGATILIWLWWKHRA